VALWDGRRYVGFAFWNGQSPNANGDYEFTYSFFFNTGRFDPETGDPIVGYHVGGINATARPTEYVSLMAGEFIGGGGLFQSKKPREAPKEIPKKKSDNRTPEQAPRCDPRGNSGNSLPGGMGVAAGFMGPIVGTGSRIGTGAAVAGAVAFPVAGLTFYGVTTIGLLIYGFQDRGKNPEADNNPFPPIPSTCPTPMPQAAKSTPEDRLGNYCKLVDQTGRICTYECETGGRFTQIMKMP
jgi:hypothetical protein